MYDRSSHEELLGQCTDAPCKAGTSVNHEENHRSSLMARAYGRSLHEELLGQFTDAPCKAEISVDYEQNHRSSLMTPRAN